MEISESELSEDDYKLICSQRYNSSVPLHLVRMSWPIMTLRQKLMSIGYIAICTSLGLLFVFGGTLEYLIMLG